jgi:fatty acid CoA ligase FadD32
MALGSLLSELAEDAPRSTLIELVATWAVQKPDAPAYTFVDYSADPRGLKVTYSWAETYRRSRAMAVRLRHSAEPGDRVALLLPQGLDYMTTMLAAMWSRVIAVPLFSPDSPGHADRLIGAYTDSEPAVVVTTRAASPDVERFLAGHDVPRPKEIIFAEDIDEALAAGWVDEPIGIDEVAYLQYTSGSTRRPAGVEITHGNVDANARQLWSGWRPQSTEPVMVSWLPLFHDMGLIASMALPMVHGNHTIFTDPVSFLMNPLRWLQLISEHDCVYTAGPNFAYEYVTERATPEKIAGLDLSGLVTCLNGAEPVRPSTLKLFGDTFGPVGLRAGAQGPGYGLAEATVFVCAAADDAPPKIVVVDRDALLAGSVAASGVASGGGHTTSLVSCGRPMGQYVAIVDPDTSVEQPDDRVGEIWVYGPNVAPGYWKNSERSQDTFGGRLISSADLPQGPWMRTGDFGVIHEGELYVTGRIKDLIIVDGTNHYPQDLEVTVQEAHPAVRPDFVAAFAVPGGETERLVVVAERNRRVPLARLDLVEVEVAVRSAVNVEHEMAVHEFVLIEPGGLSRTSSGKVARAATKQRHLDGDLPTTRVRLAARN